MYLFIFAALVLAVGILAGTAWGKKRLLVVCAGFAIGLVAVASFRMVPTGHTGVITSFGRVENRTLDAGMHVVAPWKEVVCMDNRIQKRTTDMFCFSSDIQEVSMTYTVNYRISKADAMTIYDTIGTDYYETVIAPAVAESAKIVTAKYSAEDLISMRTELASGIEKDLGRMLEPYHIEVVGTAIENMDFTDAFTEAVENKQVATQEKLAAETMAERARIEAEAAADVRKVEADAAAYETLAQAQAEAEANQMLSESLTESVLEHAKISKWDGALPYAVSDGTMPVLNF